MDVEVGRGAQLPPAGAGGRPGEAGFSMIEALVAAAILLLIAIGLLPLFAQSILNNAAGSDHTIASMFAKDELEDLQDAAFNNTPLVLGPVDVTLQASEFWLPGTLNVGDESWVTVIPPGGRQRWRRTTTVTQYSISALKDDNNGIFDGEDDWVLTDDERKPGNAQGIEVHLKLIEVRIDSGKSATGLPAGPALIYRSVKPF